MTTAEDLTRRLLGDAGIGQGMRVLDLGCGQGAVTFMAAELVGGQGRVVGVDLQDAPLEIGRNRASELGLKNVSFAQADISTMPLDHGPFDAVLGRRVLMYQPDPVTTLKHIKQLLRPGGIVVLQEHDSTSMPIIQRAMPLHERAHGWIRETIAREGADTHVGLNLHAAMVQAGFAVERVRAEATVITPDQPHAIGAIVRAMLPRIVGHNVASESEIGVDTLDDRLADECRKFGATCVWELVFGAWARKVA